MAGTAGAAVALGVKPETGKPEQPTDAPSPISDSPFQTWQQSKSQNSLRIPALKRALQLGQNSMLTDDIPKHLQWGDNKGAQYGPRPVVPGYENLTKSLQSLPRKPRWWEPDYIQPERPWLGYKDWKSIKKLGPPKR